MEWISEEGQRIFYVYEGQGEPLFLFIPSTGGDHTQFESQRTLFSRFGRVVVPDPPGHGKSDKSEQDYSIEGYATAFMSLCNELGSKEIIVVGSSTGGNISVEMAARFPNVVKAAVMIDSAAFMTSSVRAAIEGYGAQLEKGEYVEMLQAISDGSCLPTDRCKQHMAELNKRVPPHIWRSVFRNLIRWDKGLEQRLGQCRAPILYIEASSPGHDRSRLADLERFATVYRSLSTGKVVGSGHYPSLEVPDQVNSMIFSFLESQRIFSLLK